MQYGTDDVCLEYSWRGGREGGREGKRDITTSQPFTVTTTKGREKSNSPDYERFAVPELPQPAASTNGAGCA